MKSLPDLCAGFREHAALKLACHAGLGLWIVVFYFTPQWWPLFEALPAPALRIDEWVAFQPRWAPVYQSVFLVHALALWLPRDAAAVARYAALTAGAYAICAIVFFFHPTISPRPAGEFPLLYRLLISGIDGPRNAFPSLHAALATLAALTLDRSLSARHATRWWRAALALWWCALLYSTLATRQHRVLDLAAGVALMMALISIADPVARKFARRSSESLHRAAARNRHGRERDSA